jgi:hypothetical protein
MMMTRLRILGLGLAAAGVAVAVGAVNASCSQTPTNVLVRTFELAQKVDVVCMQVNDQYGNMLPGGPVPAAEDNCAPVALNTSGAPLPYHLFAAVTQLARGELAIVDLTAGNVVDEDRATPGIQFIAVGSIPTDVKVAPDAQMTFVSSADPLKPAIYGIPNTRLLGDSVGSPPPLPLQITDLFACALPQPPQGLTIATLADGSYVLVALLRASAGSPAAVAAIDPRPMLAGAGLSDGGAGVGPGQLPACTVLGATAFASALPPSWSPGPAWPDGVPYVDGGVNLADAEPSPGVACGVPAGGGAGDGGAPPSPDGGADAGMPFALGPVAAPHPTFMAMRDDVPLVYVADDGLPVIHVIDLSDPTQPAEAPPLLATSVLEPTRQVSVGQLALSPTTRDYHRYLYAVDSKVGTVMVYDVTDPKSTVRVPMQRPHPELNPFSPPDRLAFSAPVATMAFVEHDWPLPSPAEPSNPVHNYSGLLCNPNQNANPNPTTFNAKGAYYRADQASVIQSSGTVVNFPSRLRGIFGFLTLSNGTIVVIDVDDWDAPCRRPDPMSDGAVVDITNVSYSGPMNGRTGVLDVPQYPEDGGVPQLSPDGGLDLDPYHTPLNYNAAINESAGTTIEAFFPVSAPHRMRSQFLLRNDSSSGLHVPNLIAPVLLFDVNGSPLPTSGTQGFANPLMLPTPLSPNFVDPSRIQNPTEPNPSNRTTTLAGLAQASAQGGASSPLVPGANEAPADIRISFDDPTAHVDQDWSVTYEGVIPTVNNVTMDVASYDDYQTLTLATGYGPPGAGDAGNSPSPAFCSRGIEDWSIGQQRANAVLAALSNAQLPTPGTGASGNPTLPQWTSDYVEFSDDLLANTDAYWGVPSFKNGAPVNDCWDGALADDASNTADPSPHAQDRYNACFQAFDAAANDDTHYARDLPIIEAYNDHLVLGRFGWLPNPPAGDGGAGQDAGVTTSVGEQPNNRVVVGPDDSNKPFLRFARCCFHHQANFKVRTGGEWVANGSTTGLLHHVVTDPATQRCVLSCDPRDVLKNARAFDVPWAIPDSNGSCTPPTLPASLDRNSVLAMRNPMFSYVIWQGCTPLAANDHTETARDMVWRFSLRGGLSPLTMSITQGTTTAVSPQSMRFIDSLGQLAVVDGSQQGLVLFDLNSLTFAHNPYF